MKFVVDCMLGKLAKWLKILGFDALFFSKIADDDLLAEAAKGSRVLLTKDTGLIQKARNVEALFLESEEWPEQVRQVLTHFDLRQQVKPHTRCIDCNVALKDLSKENAKNLVSPFVFEHADAFALCPGCSKVFWRGSHFKDMEAQIEQILKEEP